MSTTPEVSAPGDDAVPAARGGGRDLPVPPGFDITRYLSGIGANLAGPANVILQLSWPGVGYGVRNSRVESGSAMKHPFKRARTTFTYLAVALLGTDEDRTTYRKAVNGQHAQVYSRPGEEVEYRALDPRLQTWVAACLYYGTIDMREKMHGPLPDDEADALYRYCSRFGTTLQMPADAWPADRQAFEKYWEDGVAEASIDPAIRSFLADLTSLQNFPFFIRMPLGRFVVFVTTGFLPPRFRKQMQLPWDARRQRRFDRLLRALGALERRLPTMLRIFPFNLYLRDMRLRRRLGRPLV